MRVEIWKKGQTKEAFFLGGGGVAVIDMRLDFYSLDLLKQNRLLSLAGTWMLPLGEDSRCLVAKEG